MDYDSFVDTLMSNHIPDATLIAGGILAVIIALLYRSDSDSAKYKIVMIIGTAFGIFMAIVAFNTYGTLFLATSIIMVIASFTLIIRPFRDIHFAVIIALLAMAIVYVLLGGLEGTALNILSEGWYRVGVAFFCGFMVYMMLHMMDTVVRIIGKILNAWPVLFVLGVICIIEGIMVATGNASVYDYVRSLF